MFARVPDVCQTHPARILEASHVWKKGHDNRVSLASAIISKFCACTDASRMCSRCTLHVFQMHLAQIPDMCKHYLRAELCSTILGVELNLLSATTGKQVIIYCKSQLAHHGIPNRLITDNGPQFSRDIFKQFVSDCSFDYHNSSPHYP